MHEEEIFELLKSWNQRNTPPMDLKELQKTIENIGRKHHEFSTTRLSDGTAFTGEENERQQIIQNLEDLLKLKIVEITMTTGDDPDYYLEFEKGICKLSSADLLSPTKFQQSVAKATRCVIKKLGPKSHPPHDVLAQWILDAAETQESGPETTEHGVFKSMMKEYLSTRNVPDVDDKATLEGPFKKDGLIWINSSEISKWSKHFWAEQVSIPFLAKRLTRLQAKRKTFYSGGTARFMWGLDERELN